MIWALWWGPTFVDEGIRRCEAIKRQSTSKRLEATAMLIGGSLKAASGALDEGRADECIGKGAIHLPNSVPTPPLGCLWDL